MRFAGYICFMDEDTAILAGASSRGGTRQIHVTFEGKIVQQARDVSVPDIILGFPRQPHISWAVILFQVMPISLICKYGDRINCHIEGVVEGGIITRYADPDIIRTGLLKLG